ncbi:MAG: porin [Agitococcus sp.]|nr:porin [Agitococcus sp.]
MKRNLLALAVGVAFVLPLAAQAAPTVYGRLNLSVDYMDMDTNVAGVDGKVWELNSNASRVGIKGNEKLTDELTAVYKAEWEVQGDMAGGKDLDARERYIGLKHYQWGTVRLGYIDSPLKNAEDSVDVFNDSTRLDMSSFVTGQTRLKNSINYVSPKFLDVFGANITLQPGEKAANVNEDHIADGISAAFSYEDDSLYLSFAMDKEITTSLPSQVTTFIGPASQDRDAMRLNARYKMNELTLSAMFQQSEMTTAPVGTKLDEQAVVVSASYDMDKLTFRGEVGMNNFDAGTGFEVDTTLIGLGIDYNLTQSTKAYMNLVSRKDEPSTATGFKDVDTMYLGFGMETRF